MKMLTIETLDDITVEHESRTRDLILGSSVFTDSPPGFQVNQMAGKVSTDSHPLHALIMSIRLPYK